MRSFPSTLTIGNVEVSPATLFALLPTGGRQGEPKYVAQDVFGALLQSYISGSYRARRTMVISVGAFVAILVAILGIHHV